MTATPPGAAREVPTGADDATTSRRFEALDALYQAFNDRDIDTVLAAMSPDVDWPNGWEGGRLHGHAEVRRYWERQWVELRARQRPTSFAARPDGTVEVTVHQVFRAPSGEVLQRVDARHVYTFAGDLVVRMHTDS